MSVTEAAPLLSFRKSIEVKAGHGKVRQREARIIHNSRPLNADPALPSPSHATHHDRSHSLPCLEHSSTTALARFSLGPAMDQDVSRQTAHTNAHTHTGVKVKIGIVRVPNIAGR